MSMGDMVVGTGVIKVVADTSGFKSDLEKGTKSALGSIGRTIQGTSRAALGGVVAIGTGLFALGTQLDDVYDTIRIGTGKTGDALKGLEGDFNAVAKDSTSSLGDVGTAIADLNTTLGLTGDPLRKMADQVLDLGKITGVSSDQIVSSASKVFNQFNITGDAMGKTLDSVFQASQASGVGVTDLFDAVNKGGAVFAQFGLSVADSADLLALLGKNGVAPREAMMSLTKVLDKAGKAGVPPRKALDALIESIKTAKTDADATTIAMEAFGPKAGPKLALQIRDGTFALGDLSKALGKSKDSISDVEAETADAKETFQKLKNTLAITLAPAANKVFNSIGKAATNAAPALVMVADAITPIITAIASLPAPVLAAVIGILGLGATMGKLAGTLRMVTGAVRAFTLVLSTNPYIVIIAATILLTILIVKNWDTIKATVVGAIDWIGAHAHSVFDWLVGIPKRIGDAFKSLGKILSGPFITAFTVIAKAWNNSVGKLAFTLPSWVPLLGGKGFAMPKMAVPQAAYKTGVDRVPGGRNDPMLAVLHGQERVLSASQADAADRGGGYGSMTVQGPLVAFQGPVSVRSDGDLTKLARGIARETELALRGKGITSIRTVPA